MKSTKRRRRSPAQIEQLERQILDVLKADNPQSVRHVFYRMTDPRLPEPVDKSEAGYRQVQQRVAAMRRAGSIPYGWIADMTRRGHRVDTFANAGEFIKAQMHLYRADLWRDARVHCEVWAESRSIAAVVEDDCYDLAVPLYPCGGFASLTLCYEAATEINELLAGSTRRDVVILFIGDYDPAGVLIDQHVEREIRAHLAPGFALDFRRLAINRDQIAAYDLPTKPRKANDRRRLDIRETVEAEAMPAGDLRGMVRSEVESLLPAGALERAKVAEESERDGLIALGIWVETFGTQQSVDGLKRGLKGG